MRLVTERVSDLGWVTRSDWAHSGICSSAEASVAAHKAQFGNDVLHKVWDIHCFATSHGLTLSRWQTNGAGGGVKRITYVVHGGERAAQTRQQGNVVIVESTHTIEGTTKRCDAYAALERVWEELVHWSESGVLL